MREAAPTPLGQWIAAWLTHQRSLGRGYDGEQWVLAHLRRFVASTNAADLDQAGFDRWCASFANLSTTTRRGRQLAVRKFCLFRQRTEPDCFVPDPLYFVRLCPYRRPVIIEPSQVEQMLTVADSLVPTANSPLLPGVMHLAVVILYTAGLRRGELARLVLEDIEPQTGVLRIRTSKFHKSRLVPLSPTANDALRAYLRQRLSAPFDTDPSAALLCWGRHGRRGYTGAGLGQAINRLLVAADVLDAEGRRPRVHDMRHSFAVQALMRWYRAGADDPDNLPRLAIYMGHVSIGSTAQLPALHTGDAPTCKRPLQSLFGAGCRRRRCRHEDVSAVRPWQIDRRLLPRVRFRRLRGMELAIRSKAGPRRPGPVPAVRCQWTRGRAIRISWSCRHHRRSGRPLPCLPWKPPRSEQHHHPAMRGSPLCSYLRWLASSLETPTTWRLCSRSSEFHSREEPARPPSNI